MAVWGGDGKWREGAEGVHVTSGERGGREGEEEWEGKEERVRRAPPGGDEERRGCQGGRQRRAADMTPVSLLGHRCRRLRCWELRKITDFPLTRPSHLSGRGREGSGKLAITGWQPSQWSSRPGDNSISRPSPPLHCPRAGQAWGGRGGGWVHRRMDCHARFGSSRWVSLKSAKGLYGKIQT